MKNNLKSLLCLAAVLCMLISVLAACEAAENETESSSETESGSEEKLTDFDFASADLSNYITISASDYLNNTVTLSTDYLISDDIVEEYIANELFKNKSKTNGDAHVVDQPIKLGDSAFIYYTGYLADVPFEGGSNANDAKPYELSIGSGAFIDGFEDGLIGVVPNETSKEEPFDLHVTFPENYSSRDLAGKAVVFKVWIEYTVSYTIPELSDNFVKNTLKFDGTAEDYKDYIKKNLQYELTAKAEDEALNAVQNKLIENSKVIEYPQESVDYYYQSYIDYFESERQYYAMYGYNFDSIKEFLVTVYGFDKDNWEKDVTDLAKKSVHNSLIFYSIAKAQNITVSDEEFNKYVEIMIEETSSDSQKYTAEEIISKYGRQQITEVLLSDKVNDFLMDNCTIEYKDK